MFNVLGDLSVAVQIRDTSNFLMPSQLFEVAARINKKRQFLFVSKVLGKHLPVFPEIPLLAGAALADAYIKEIIQEPLTADRTGLTRLMSGLSSEKRIQDIPLEEPKYSLPERTLFIGFAETATGLGHAMAAMFNNALFFHTTREVIDNKASLITFEEEHSHATSHYCYIDAGFLENDSPVVLVDDEMTTGKTALNIIESIQNKFPRSLYIVVSLLDWRSDEHIRRFIEMEEALGIKIRTVSLLSGQLKIEGVLKDESQKASIHKPLDPVPEKKSICMMDLPEIPVPVTSYHNPKGLTNYVQETGRFGLESSNNDIDILAKAISLKIEQVRTGEKVLCLGTGEFIYLPLKIASFMKGDVYFQSTTRSPIYPDKSSGYPIKSKYTFLSPENQEIDNYFYQVEKEMYDEVFVFLEREHQEAAIAPLMNELARVIPKVTVVPISQQRGE